MDGETHRCMLRYICVVSFLFIYAFICVELSFCIAVNAVMLPKTGRSEIEQAGAVSSGKQHNLSHPTQGESIQEPCTMLFTLGHFVSLHVSIDRAATADTTRISKSKCMNFRLGFLSGSSRQCQYRISRTNSWLNTNQRAPSRYTEHSKKLRYSLCSQGKLFYKNQNWSGYWSKTSICRGVLSAAGTYVTCCGDVRCRGWRLAWEGRGGREWRRLLNDVYCWTDIIRVVKSRSIRWAGHVARTEEKRIA